MALKQEPSSLSQLKALGKELSRQSLPESTISIKLAKFAAAAIKKYLSGKCKSLDEAFGLNPKRGMPGYPEVRQRLAKITHLKRRTGKSYQTICDELEQAGYKNMDPGTLRRTYMEFLPELVYDDRVASIWTDVRKNMKEANRKKQISDLAELEAVRKRIRETT